MTKPSGNSLHVCHHRRRTERQIEAEARQMDAAKRTPEQQLALLDSRPGNSRRERSKLAAALAVKPKTKRKGKV